jgi:hypothetical protein
MPNSGAKWLLASTCFENYLLILRTRWTSGTCTRIEVSASILVQPADVTCMQYIRTKCCLCSTSWGWASNAWNMKRHLILNKLNKKCMVLVSLYWYTMMHGQSLYWYTTMHSQQNINHHWYSYWNGWGWQYCWGKCKNWHLMIYCQLLMVVLATKTHNI